MMLSGMLLTALALVSNVVAWGDAGHEAVGYVAQAFLTSGAAKFVHTHLDRSDHGFLWKAATWADKVRYTHAYRWSEPWHFVDAEDEPSDDSCSVERSRDCGKSGCVLSAIANYTTRIVDKGLSMKERGEALKFLTHFLGDITQPLHDENFKHGGNGITVTFDGRPVKLHALWDTNMLEASLKTSYGKSVTTYAKSLISRIRSGDLHSQASQWIGCVDPTQFTASQALQCPLEWAQDSNTLDCSFVFDYDDGDDLATSGYYTNAIPLIDVQLAKGGYRLAAWLNTLFDGSPGLPSEGSALRIQT